MGKNKPIEIHGVEYPSMVAAAKDLGVKYARIYRAKKSGRLDTVGVGRDIPTMYRGKLFKSQTAAAMDLGVSSDAIRYHLDKFGTLDHLEPKAARHG